MSEKVNKDLGEQPLAALMEARDLKPDDIATASTVQMTHKMAARTMKCRRLSANVKCKVRDAL